MWRGFLPPTLGYKHSLKNVTTLNMDAAKSSKKEAAIYYSQRCHLRGTDSSLMFLIYRM
jgi:hypothetical protein